ncbi:hypothetical protein C8J56DRAFT_785967 [Mycena floridula]|nr:hypothetical protein C8J56DRAFT_785967 [Mycena floridula]
MFQEIQRGWTNFGNFLVYLFTVPGPKEPNRSPSHAATISAFLRGAGRIKAPDIANLMLNSKESRPAAVRNGLPETATMKEKRQKMAKWGLQQWAIQVVGTIISDEVNSLASKAGGLRLSTKDMTWQSFHSFSLATIIVLIETTAPTILYLLLCAVYPSKKRPLPVSDSTGKHSYISYVSQSLVSGSGKTRRNPFIIVIVVILMLMNARNLRSTFFQKAMGVWLFANSASKATYAVLGRMGLSVSYSSVLKVLKSLAGSSRETIQKKAKDRGFLIIYDNINRMRRSWDPDLGQGDTMLNGTAATYVVVEDCDVQAAFNPVPLEEARKLGNRRNLTLDVLHKQVDWDKINETMALHVLNFLINSIPTLSKHKKFVQNRFETRLAGHRMRRNRRTTVHPLGSSNHDEGSTSGNMHVLDDIHLNQLELNPEEVDELLELCGGDQSTVEKQRALQKFLRDCPHRYHKYGWLIPLIQLWHMGWADLERILNTHWGKAENNDPSSFWFVNHLLKRKIKDQKRPDYYPTQKFIFENLEAEVMGLWRIVLGKSDLETHFNAAPETNIEDLNKMANDIVYQYMSSQAHTRALYATQARNDKEKWFPNGPASTVDPDLDPTTAVGDKVLANTILRLRDSMLHYEFHAAVADGDIGRAMNVMAVWTFTFPGSGRSKYANELLEIVCNFEYEYSDDLKQAILNNWLCNLTGFDGCWFPMDLLQEHNIKQLKKMAERRNAEFNDPFFRDIISYNIRAFLEIIDSMKTSAQLNATSKLHTQKKKVSTLKSILRSNKDTSVHKFCAGRDLGHLAQDDFQAGHIMLGEGKKLKEFLDRTARDMGNIYEGDGAEQAEEVIEEEQDDDDQGPPLRNMMLDGRLVSGQGFEDDESDSDDSASEASDPSDDEPEPVVDSD